MTGSATISLSLVLMTAELSGPQGADYLLGSAARIGDT